MSHAIVGFGPVGQALARAFARKNIEVAVASRRPPQALAPQAQAIGSTVVPKTMREAIKATDRWAQIAPTPPRTGASEPSRLQAATPRRSAA